MKRMTNKLLFTFSVCLVTMNTKALDMTQDRPLNGLSPTPDEVYVAPNNAPSLRKHHCPCNRSAEVARSQSCFPRWKRHKCNPCQCTPACECKPLSVEQNVQ